MADLAKDIAGRAGFSGLVGAIGGLAGAGAAWLLCVERRPMC
jgi:hypothetical protein